jgi:opacity protein-like surface antigen
MKKFLLIALVAISVFVISSLQASSKEEMKIGGDIGIALPMGDFGDFANTGFGLNAVFSYFLNPQLAITGTLGYWSFGSKVDGYSFSTVPLNGGIQYRFNKGKFQPFVSAETLMFFNSVSYKYLGYSASDSKTEFGFVPGIGAAFPLENDIEIRAAIKYTIIFTSGSNTTFLGIMGGVHFKM